MFEVILTERAEEELKQQHTWWAENRSEEQANRWYVGFIRKMLTLEHNPKRCAYALENSLFPCQVHQLNYGLGRKPTHRAIYTIIEKKVTILRVRHLRQKMLSEDDI